MATAEQLKSLIRTHFRQDAEGFTTVALQLAAHEARQGHKAVAKEIRDLVDANRKSENLQLAPAKKSLAELVYAPQTRARLSDMVLNSSQKKRLERILKEYRNQDKIKAYGLNPRRKVLLTGKPGTGKTMTASVLAGELHMPLFIVQMDRLVSKYMGETSAKLRLLFDGICEHRAIYLFDEFDTLGASRGRENEVGEMRRVLNTFLQFIEQDASDSLIVAATNNQHILDQALYRRFDDLIHYTLPEEDMFCQLVENRLERFLPNSLDWKSLWQHAKGLSHAEISQACVDAVKEAILEEWKAISTDALIGALKDRKL